MKTNLIHKLCIRFLLLAMTIATVTATPVSRTRDLVTEDKPLPRSAADPIHVEMEDLETRGWPTGSFFGPSPTLPYSTHDLPNAKPKLAQIPSHLASHETNARVKRPLPPPPKQGEVKGDPYLRPIDFDKLTDEKKQSRRQVVIENYATMLSASFERLGMKEEKLKELKEFFHDPTKFLQDTKKFPKDTKIDVWEFVEQPWKDTMQYNKFWAPPQGQKLKEAVLHGSPKIEVKYRDFDEL